MIQRKQTLFLLIAIILTAFCFSSPLASFEPKGMGMSTELWVFGTMTPDSGVQFNRITLFILLAIAEVIEIATIFLYRNRMQQAKLCVLGIVLYILWYAYYVYCAIMGVGDAFIFHINFAACLPLCSIIALVLARHGIIKDEELVRAADRIR